MVDVLVDNPSWILPYADELVAKLKTQGDDARLIRSSDNLRRGHVAFLLGCMKLIGPDALSLHHRNLVVHESALPKGRGFSPLTWQIIEGHNEIPVCLVEAIAEQADAGGVVLQDTLRFSGHELCGDLRHAQGRLTIDLCLRFMSADRPLLPQPQIGSPTFYRRRRPSDSRLDPSRSLAEQFFLLRVVDNDRYPAFFDLNGHRYILRIEKEGQLLPEVGDMT